MTNASLLQGSKQRKKAQVMPLYKQANSVSEADDYRSTPDDYAKSIPRSQ